MGLKCLSGSFTIWLVSAGGGGGLDHELAHPLRGCGLCLLGSVSSEACKGDLLSVWP